MEIPPLLLNALRSLAVDVVRREAPTRAEHEALAQLVHSRLALITPQDRQALGSLLPALLVLRGGQWVQASEVLELAQSEDSEAGHVLAAALAPYMTGKEPARSVGRFLTRCTAVPVQGLYLRRLQAKRADKDPCLYAVAGF